MKQEGERRNIFLRYLGEVATAVSDDQRRRPRKALRPTAARGQDARPPRPTSKLDERGKPVEEEAEDFGDNVLIVDPNCALRRHASARRNASRNAKHGK